VWTQSNRTDFRLGGQHALKPEIAAIQDTLRQQYKSEWKSYEQALEHWKDKQFAAVGGDPTQEAALDVKRFVAKYFLDSINGLPDRSKTNDPVVLRQSYGDVTSELLMDAHAEIPGLKLRTYDDSHLAIIGWDTEMPRAIESEFARLSTSERGPERIATAEANFEVPLFLKKHLGIHVALGGVVALPRERTPTPVVLLHSFLKEGYFLKRLIDEVPQLCVQYAKNDNVEPWELNARFGKDRFGKDRRYSHMVIGWDAKRVDAEISRIKAVKQSYKDEKEAGEVAAKEQEAAEEQTRWHRPSEPHRQYVARQTPPSGPLGLKDLTGSYIVRWDGEGRECSYPHNVRDALRLDVFEQKSAHGVMASFKFGLINGTMRLAMSRRSVELLREEQPKNFEESLEEDYESIATGQKRKLGSVADPWGVQAAMAKRQKTEAAPEQASQPNRVYLQFVYNEARGYAGDPVVDEDNSYIGHIDFDASKLSAKGSMIVPAYGPEPQLFEIFKVADEPLTESEARYWYLFDGRRGAGW
jgi:hypothetical protein